MPYNQALAQRIRVILSGYEGIVEKKMFGGVGFLLNGNMAFGVMGEDLIARVGNAGYEAALSQPFVRPFLSPGGKPMAGWVLVSAGGLKRDQDLQQWIDRGYQFAGSLPGKNHPSCHG